MNSEEEISESEVQIAERRFLAQRIVEILQQQTPSRLLAHFVGLVTAVFISVERGILPVDSEIWEYTDRCLRQYPKAHKLFIELARRAPNDQR